MFSILFNILFHGPNTNVIFAIKCLNPFIIATAQSNLIDFNDL